MTKRKVMVAGAVLTGLGIISDELHQVAYAEPVALIAGDTPSSAYIRQKEIPFRVVSPKSSLAAPSARREVQPMTIEYSVRKGDTLSHIAKRFRVTVQELVEINQIRNPNRISINQKLRIPVKSSPQGLYASDSYTELSKSNTNDSNTELSNTKVSIKPDILERFPKNHGKATNKKKTVRVASVSLKPISAPIQLSFSWPVKDYRITSYFGWRWGDHHDGIDIVSRSGNFDIHAAKTGTVRFSGKSGNGYGNLVILDHGNGVETYYAHLSKVLVREGDVVRAGDVIGKMGTTGHSTGIHLHFEIRKYDKPVNPLRLLARELKPI